MVLDRCSTACGIFLDQGSNLCLLHRQVVSLLLSHQETPLSLFLIMALDHLQEEEEAGWKAMSSRPPQVSTMKVLKLQGRILLWQVIAWDEGEGWGTRATLPPPTQTWGTARVLGLGHPRILTLLQGCLEFLYSLQNAFLSNSQKQLVEWLRAGTLQPNCLGLNLNSVACELCPWSSYGNLFVPQFPLL